MTDALRMFFKMFTGKRWITLLVAIVVIPLTSFWIIATAIVPEFAPKKPGVKRIVIDPGHGGKDSGCLGASAREKEVALAIGLKLGKFIEENFKDVEVIYTRKTDVFVELQERANIANKAEADLFICIHANSGPEKAHGTETYIMGNHKSESNLKVAQRENASILLEENYEVKYGGFDPKSAESYIVFNLMQSAYQDNSTLIAKKIQKQFTDLGRRDRGVKQAGFLVLHQTAMPSVLIETGFLTNKEEEKFLSDPESQNKMANCIYKAFREYKIEVESKIKGVGEEDQTKETPIEEKAEPAEKTKQPEKAHGTSLYGSDKPKEKKEEQPKKEKPVVEKKKTDKKADPDAIGMVEGLVFRVQIASSSKKLPIKAKNFKGLEGVKYIQKDTVYRYYYGEASSLDAITPLKEQAKSVGYSDAFVIAFLNGNRIPLTEALKLAPPKK